MKELIAAAFAGIGFFALGVAFHKWAISEAENVKKHISDEIGSVRNSVRILRDEVATKLHS